MMISGGSLGCGERQSINKRKLRKVEEKSRGLRRLHRSMSAVLVSLLLPRPGCSLTPRTARPTGIPVPCCPTPRSVPTAPSLGCPCRRLARVPSPTQPAPNAAESTPRHTAYICVLSLQALSNHRQRVWGPGMTRLQRCRPR